jgi:hypothetical protein
MARGLLFEEAERSNPPEISMGQPVIVIAILRYQNDWRVVADCGAMGRCYGDRVDAEESALRFAVAARGCGRPVEILLQQPSGEMRPLAGDIDHDAETRLCGLHGTALHPQR